MTEKRTISRSEEVRQRRTQKETKRQRTAGEHAYRPLPPVTSRNVSIFGVETAARRKPAARRYHSAIGMPREQGWRRLLPMLPEVQTGPRLISFILVLLLGAAVYFFAASPEFRVAEPQINGLVRLTPAEVNSMLGLGGQLIFTLRPDDVAARVRTTFPELASASVQVALPNKVIITVQERQPVLLWQQGNGFTWVDESGVAFRPHGEAQGLISVVALASPPGAAAVDDLSPSSFVAPDLVKTARLLSAGLPQGASLIYDPKDGFGWPDPRGWNVFFGSESKDVPLKLRIYQSLVDSLTSQGAYPVYISVVHADAPYYRMEK